MTRTATHDSREQHPDEALCHGRIGRLPAPDGHDAASYNCARIRRHPAAAERGTIRSAGVGAHSINRWADWWEQALRDLTHAGHAAEDADDEWSASAAQQAAEKALKAVIIGASGEPWGHLTTGLAEALPSEPAPSEILDAARRLDKHYIPSRYPNGFAAGFPGRLYTRGEAEQAISDATSIIDFCRSHLPR